MPTVTPTDRNLPPRAPRSGGFSGPSSGEDGQSLVEFALALPVLLMVLMGISIFGVACNNYVMLTNATSVSARALAVSRGQTTDPCSTASSTLLAALPTFTTSNVTLKITLNGTSYSGNSCSSSTTTTGSSGNLVAGTSAKVVATYPCSLTVMKTNYAPNGCTLTAQMTELVQ